MDSNVSFEEEEFLECKTPPRLLMDLEAGAEGGGVERGQMPPLNSQKLPIPMVEFVQILWLPPFSHSSWGKYFS
jgi:hypothetical protein